MAYIIKDNILYNDMKFKWANVFLNDVPVRGVCYYKGRVCMFGTVDYLADPVLFHVYHLSFWEKARWLFRQMMFEICVGDHFTYPFAKSYGVPHPTRWARFLLRWYYRLGINDL